MQDATASRSPLPRAVWLLLSAVAFAAVASVAAPSTPDNQTPPAGADEPPATEAAADKAPPPTEEKTRYVPLIVAEEPPPEFRGPDVTLIASEERMVYEYRQNGQLRMIKVVPKLGKPYYLVPYDRTRGFGDLEQAKTLVAEWVLWEF
ncbi:MAG: DUF2782 domain-containing protein [Gammaproteobacteria bacterium]|nr:DUF2782 domain-containing protein [Gammaproteobacteria bacterium]